MKDQNEKIENDFKDNFKDLEVNFKLREEKIIKNANKIITDNFQKFLIKTNQLKIKTIETQTEINVEEGKTSWSQQKIDEQTKTIERLQFQIKDWEKN